MKKILVLTLCGLVIQCSAQTQPHEWHVTFKAIDDAGNPVAGAKAKVGYYQHSQPASIDGLTDTNGFFTASHMASSGLVGGSVEKEGYYTTLTESHDLGFDYKPERWNITNVLVLKKINHPIAMYAKWVNTHVPDLDKPIGYDLMVGDWIAPYGKGTSSDILFTGHLEKHGEEQDYTLTVSFPHPGDGIQAFFVPEAEKGSGLKSPQEAPVDGYQPQWVLYDRRKPNQPVDTNYDRNRNYLFQVRTVLDENGKIVSAHYGKIYGDFMQFTHYLNPTPNSRNIEFDTKQNLTPLKRTDLRVQQP